MAGVFEPEPNRHTIVPHKPETTSKPVPGGKNRGRRKPGHTRTHTGHTGHTGTGKNTPVHGGEPGHKRGNGLVALLSRPRAVEPWPRQLDRKLDSYLTGYSTATRQDSSTATRQFSTDLDRTPLTACDGASRCQARQLDSSTDLDRPRQTNDRPRQSRADTDQPIRMPPPFRCQKERLAWGSHS